MYGNGFSIASIIHRILLNVSALTGNALVPLNLASPLDLGVIPSSLG